ncbi:hypothetical protein [Andreprevotia chitinilytica]|uniref:hypothetical protein n=1 Tax=Andreprevotia chitinilytica TaxID=396808 RepID=UPI0012EC54AF|nr:hypothetical protein [Andreprevotia chitinilytica]
MNYLVRKLCVGVSLSMGLLNGANATYVNGNPLGNIDPTGLACTAANGTVTCNVPGGPTISFPRPPKWPDHIQPGDSNYHYYDKWVNAGKTDSGCLQQYIQNHPTPGSPQPATPSGTQNDASPLWASWLTSSPVRSYSMTSNGVPVVVNVTMPDHPLFPGYVARTVVPGSNGNIVNNFGEGTGLAQNPYMPGSDKFINNVWYGLTQNAIDACSCSK